MELIDILKDSIVQCEGRYKHKRDEKEKTPYQRYPHIIDFCLFIDSKIKKEFHRELFLFVPSTKNDFCYITEESNFTLSIKEIFDDEDYLRVQNELSLLYERLIKDVSVEKFSNDLFIFNYDKYKVKASELTRSLWRIFNIITDSNFHSFRLLIKKVTKPQYYKQNFTLTEGYLFCIIEQQNIRFEPIHNSFLSMENNQIYTDYAKALEDNKKHDQKKMDLDNTPGSLENRIFIGGNYDYMALLREIYGIVEDNNFVPILAYDFNVNKKDIHDADLRLLHNCKYAIFEITTYEGSLMEIERTRDYLTEVLLLYQVRGHDDRDIPQHITTMLTSFSGKMYSQKGYNETSELEYIIAKWIKTTSKKMVK
jgi:hypothetical protein